MNFSRKYFVFVIPVFIGFFHGYFMSTIRNNEVTKEGYMIANENYKYEFSKVNEILANGGYKEALDYVNKLDEEDKADYLIFVSDNPDYTPIRERKNDSD